MIVQWYPGHMNKARKMMEEDVKNVDLVIELLDARCPLSSQNPDINQFLMNKLRLVLLNKADLADNKCNEAWKNYFAGKGIKVVMLDSKNKDGIRNVMPAVLEVCSDKIKRQEERGIKNQPVRAMVAGIPNVGKSTFINAFAGKNIAKTGNKPGVTKGKQWINVNNKLQLLDTPGILWPKFEDQNVGERLAFIGSINDEILPIEELAGDLLIFLYENYPDVVNEKYGINKESATINEEDADSRFVTVKSLMLDCVGRRRGLLKSGGNIDYFKAANAVLDDFRSGRLGRITLERP